MKPSPQNPQPSPELFFATVNAYQQTAALKAAVELDLFTAVGSTDGTVEQVARRTGAAARGVRILCDYLTILGFLSWLAIRFFATLALVACSSWGQPRAGQSAAPAPEQILSQALARFRTQEGVHFTGSERAHNRFLNISVHGRLSGIYRSGRVIHFQARDDASIAEDELYVVDGRTFRREPHTDRWAEREKPDESLAQILPLSQPALMQPGPWIEAALASRRGLAVAERILPDDNSACWVVELDLGGDEAGSFSRALAKALGAGIVPVDPRPGLRLRAEYWIGRDSLLIRRLGVELGGLDLADGRPSATARPADLPHRLQIDYRQYNDRLAPKLPPEIDRLLNRARSVPAGAAMPRPAGPASPAAAPEILAAASREALRQAGYRFEFDSRTDPLSMAFTADGVIRRDGISTIRAHLVFNEFRVRYYIARGAIAMTFPALAERCLPFQSDPELQRSQPHPSRLFLDRFVAEALALARGMKLGASEPIDGRRCTVLEYAAENEALAGERSKLEWDPETHDGSWAEFPLTGLEVTRGMEGWRGSGVSQRVSSLRWRIWIGSEDGLIYRLQRRVTTQIDLSDAKWRSLGAPVRNDKPYRGGAFLTTWEFRIREYNRGLDFEVPPFVQPCLR